MIQTKTNIIRIIIMVFCVLIEAAILGVIIKFFSEQAAWIEGILRLLSVGVMLYIIRRTEHLSSDLMWIILIMLFPVPGTAAYLVLGADLIISKTFRNIVKETDRARQYYVQENKILQEMDEVAPQQKGQFHYISQSAGFPFYRNTGFDYYGTGEEGFPFILEEMEKAQRYIFLEYFIIEPGTMWNQMLEILERKVAQGVECRVLYDDMGSFGTLPASYARELEKKGIKSVPFNRITPVLGTIMNHRDHRKILVIDGKVAFSGGINLADEYINKIERFGYWKDNLIRIRGEVVWSYTVLFLTTWNALRHEDSDYRVFKADFNEKATPAPLENKPAAVETGSSSKIASFRQKSNMDSKELARELAYIASDIAADVRSNDFTDIPNDFTRDVLRPGFSAQADKSPGDIQESLPTADNNLSPGTADSSLSPGAADSSLSPGAADSNLSPGTADSSLSPGAADSSLSPGTADSSLSPGAADSSLSPGTADSSLSPGAADEAASGPADFDGYIAAYGETPLDYEITSQNIYMNILNQAVNYCYIITPYLIIDNELSNALLLTAKRGVDVRILTPGIPDKKLIWMITRSYYGNLMNGGVKIYEYTPGFVHAKVFVSDDKIATVGTINLDYRSLYLHFENGTYLYNSKKVLDIRDDYLDALKVSKKIEKGDVKNGVLKETFLSFLRLFTPLL